ncbi:MAG: AAA family ATPase [Myxococcaceae bacterium]
MTATPTNGVDHRHVATIHEVAAGVAGLVERAAVLGKDDAGDAALLFRQHLTTLAVQLGDLAARSGGSGTSSGTGVVPGSPPYKGGTSTGTTRPAAHAGTTLAFETLATFLARAEVVTDAVWVWDHLVPGVGRVLIVGAPNAGKTFFVLVVARMAAAAGRVVYLVLEEGSIKALAKRFVDLGFDAGAAIHVLHQTGFRLFEHTGALVERLRAGADGPAPVIVIDPFSAVFTGDENDTEEMSAARGQLERIQRADPRALLIVPHHTSKAGEKGEAGAEMYASRGSTTLNGWADVQLNLKHVATARGSGRVELDALMAKNRDGERDYTIRVALELGSGNVTTKPLEEARADQREAAAASKVAEAEARIEAFVADSSKPLSKNQINTGVGGNRAVNFKAIDRLVEQGVLVNVGVGYSLKTGGTDA